MSRSRAISINPSFSKRMVRLLAHVKKNALYANVVAMNETAKNIQNLERKRVRKIFKIRTTWIPRGIKIRFAEHKTSKPIAKVGYVAMKQAANVAGLHEEGGKHENPGGKGVGVPIDIRGAGRTGTTPKSRWASGLLRRGARPNKAGDIRQRYFYITSKSKPGVSWLVSVAREERKRRTLLKRSGLAKTKKGAAKQRALAGEALPISKKFRFWYKMQPSSHIKPDLHFRDTMSPIARKLYGIQMRRALVRSMKERK